MTSRVLVVGCGGLGGIIAGTLMEQRDVIGAEVVALTTNPSIASAVNARGYQLRGVDGARTVRGVMASSLPDDTAPFDWIILATQPPQVEDATRRTLGWLAKDGTMVCLQNGLCEKRVGAIVGDDRVVGAVVAWGATMPEPGVYDRTAAGGFTIGTMSGEIIPRLADLSVLLEPVGPVNVTQNLAGARWSKLAINCAISTLGTIFGGRLGSAMVHRFVRRLALEIMTEVVQVARAEKVRLEKVSGTIDLDWIALTDAERRAMGSPGLLAKHSMLLAVGARYRRMRSSMLTAIERGRTPAVDFLNGEVVLHGKQHGIPTPYNAAASELVHAIARGEKKSSEATLRELTSLFTLRARGSSPTSASKQASSQASKASPAPSSYDEDRLPPASKSSGSAEGSRSLSGNHQRGEGSEWASSSRVRTGRSERSRGIGSRRRARARARTRRRRWRRTTCPRRWICVPS